MSEATEPLNTPQHAEPRGYPRGPGTERVRQRQIASGFSRGVNIEPGSDDDGWVVPPPVTLGDGTRIQLYKDGEALAAGYQAIREARRRIMLEVYIWPSDETGRAFASLLCEKAEQGLEVFAIYDGFGSFLAEADMFDEMRARGVRLIEFHPAIPWQSRYSWRPLNRDHRKLLVVDDEIAGLGGLNLGNRYAGTWVAKVRKLDVERLWRDAAVGIQGPGARQFAEAFIKTWHYCLHRGPIEMTQHLSNLHIAPAAKGRRLGKASEAARLGGSGGRWTEQTTPGRAAAAVGLFDGHGPRHGGLDELFVGDSELACLATSPTLSSPLRPFLYRLLRDARRSITLTMAYVAPDDEFINGLIAAAKRGVRVRLMFAGKTDVLALKIAARAFYERFLEAGCEVYERDHVMLHQKSVVVDGRLCVLGSTNLDYRSIESNLELSAVVRSEEFGQQLEALFDHDTHFSTQITADHWRHRPMRDRIVQWAISRMRYVL